MGLRILIAVVVCVGCGAPKAFSQVRRAASQPTSRSTGLPPDFVAASITSSEGHTQPYALFVPENYDPAKKWPLVMFLHGSGESGADGVRQTRVGLGPFVARYRKKCPFIAVFPQSPNAKTWFRGPQAKIMFEILDKVQRDYSVDPDRIYLTGISMGGFGTWTLGAHHADLFGGTAAYAGAPSPLFDPNDQSRITGIVRGVLPNLFALRHFFFQSLDDQNVPPGPNIHANKALLEWKKEHPDGFEYRYDETDGLGHAPPKEGYLPTQKWVADKKRNARPAKFLWEPVLPWKRHFYWAYWREIPTDGVYEFKAKPDNSIDVGRIGGTAAAPAKLTLFLGAPLIDLEKDVVVRIEGKEKYRGKPPRTFSTLLLTLPRFDDALLYDARIDL